MKLFIENILDSFYPLFKRFFTKRTFRYAACGGTNTLFDILLFFVNYNFILHKEVLNLSIVVISPHIAAFLLAFLISFPTGFLLMRYIVFTESPLKGRIQFFRYFVTVSFSIFLNYVFLKLFVEHFHIYPTISKVITTFIVIGFSYMLQRNFSFKVKGSSAI